MLHCLFGGKKVVTKNLVNVTCCSLLDEGTFVLYTLKKIIMLGVAEETSECHRKRKPS